MKRRRPVHMLALVLGVVAAVPSIAAADTSFPAAAGHMTARGDLLVWAPWTGPGRLMSGFGAASPLTIPRARFASVDLGADVRGRAVLVYSACQIRRPRHCDLGLYDFASRRHRRLSGLSRPGCSERGARVSRGTGRTSGRGATVGIGSGAGAGTGANTGATAAEASDGFGAVDCRLTSSARLTVIRSGIGSGVGVSRTSHHSTPTSATCASAAMPRPSRSSREREAKEAIGMGYGASTEPWVTSEMLLHPARLSSPITAMTRP